ncbi:MAG: rRNA (pseudouridine1915-N3)-methyltransferase [Alphaproteobacteria bacterium]|jgi:23S rRNA (pseudouridine1915-N3)-methyltransferase|nr:rRNA (pseudouridine1915-N3)-methyltransferase [Alphaproteobacteria bacterium]MEA2988781.1 rRNA (pseudouridine1915-N3)-methyltransferase [Alphaproteobacteria bacterium]
MRIVIAAVGRLKQGPERDLAERYRKRAVAAGRSLGLKDIDIVEIRESRADNVERRMLEESIAIANVIPERAVTAILDEHGDSVTSSAFAGHLQGWRTQDRPAAVFIIGGADGLAPSLRRQANLAVSFGAATWPHQLVRIMLLEQLYRAVTILSGHPYHRS